MSEDSDKRKQKVIKAIDKIIDEVVKEQKDKEKK